MNVYKAFIGSHRVAVYMSHHKKVKATLRITNDGKVLSLWYVNPYTGMIDHWGGDE